MKKLIPCLAVFISLLVGCGSAGSDDAIKMPLYEECIDKVMRFTEEMNEKFKGTQQKLNISMDYFNYKSDFHPSFAGVITLSGNSLDISLKVYANGIKGMCYPETSSEVDNNELGLRIINSELQRNHSKGIKNNYLSITKEKIKLFYNDK